MLFLEDIKIELKSQGFEAKQISFSSTNDSAVVCFKNTRKTKDVICPECGGKVYIHNSFDMTLKDIPLNPGMPLSLFCMGHRYCCCECNKSFTEKIPFAYPETRITKRAAIWIKSFLKNKMSNRYLEEDYLGPYFAHLKIEEITPNLIGFKYNSTKFSKKIQDCFGNDFFWAFE